MITSTVNLILSSLTIIGLMFAFVLIFTGKAFSSKGILFSFVVAFLATIGSLFYSLVAGYTPCELCWYQRIFMYPQVLILGISLIKKDRKAVDYSLSLAVIGAMISLYHNYIYYNLNTSTNCGISGISCTVRYVWEFGFVSIPLMALTAFLMIIILLIKQKIYEQD